MQNPYNIGIKYFYYRNIAFCLYLQKNLQSKQNSQNNRSKKEIIETFRPNKFWFLTAPTFTTKSRKSNVRRPNYDYDFHIPRFFSEPPRTSPTTIEGMIRIMGFGCEIMPGLFCTEYVVKIFRTSVEKRVAAIVKLTLLLQTEGWKTNWVERSGISFCPE